MSQGRTTSGKDTHHAEAVELPEYFDVGAEQLYCVHHRAIGERRGGVLIIPPFAGERADSYLTCVHWARLLARAGFDATRFDYRGTGESTGDFGALDLSDRREDARACARLLRARIGTQPLVLHGIRLGAVFAAELFAEGVGEGLLLWAAPRSSREHLWENLRASLASGMVQGGNAPRQTRENLVESLDKGAKVNVGGYFWTKGLWTSASEQSLPLPGSGERRPWRSVDVRFKVAAGGGAHPHLHQVACGRFWQESLRMHVDTTALYNDGLRWIESVAQWSGVIKESA